MVNKLKIPSNRLLLVGYGYMYKGYTAFYKERIRQGEFLYVQIGETGDHITVPIGNVVFLMDDGRELQYIPFQDGLKLVDFYTKTHPGKIITIEENTKLSPSKDEPIFLAKDLNKMVIVDEDTPIKPEILDNMLDDLRKSTYKLEKRKRSSSPDYEFYKRRKSDDDAGDYIVDDDDNDYDDEYEDQKDVTLYNDIINDNSILDQHIVTEFLNNVFTSLGFDFNTISVNQHSKILQNHISNNNQLFNDLDYKYYAIAYVFIYVNNMNIGYPILHPSCLSIDKKAYNNNTNYIMCVSKLFGFIKDKNDPNIIIYVNDLLTKMQTQIIDEQPTTHQLRKEQEQEQKFINRFSHVRVTEQTKEEIETKASEDLSQQVRKASSRRFSPFVPKLKKDRFPLMKRSTFLQLHTNVIHSICSKINTLVNTDKNLTNKQRNILIDFCNNINDYLKGPLFLKLKSNTLSMESVLLLPYIDEYKKRIELAENSFYDNPREYTFYSNTPSLSTIHNNIRTSVQSSINTYARKELVVSEINNYSKSSGSIYNKKEAENLLFVLNHKDDILREKPEQFCINHKITKDNNKDLYNKIFEYYKTFNSVYDVKLKTFKNTQKYKKISKYIQP